MFQILTKNWPIYPLQQFKSKKCTLQKDYKMRMLKYFFKISYGGCRYEEVLFKKLLSKNFFNREVSIKDFCFTSRSE